MKRQTLLRTSVTLLMLLVVSSTALAGVIAPRHLTVHLKSPTIEPPKDVEAPGVLAVVPRAFVIGADLGGDTTWEVLSPQDALEKVQDQIESLILDDAVDSNFGNRLLLDLDDVIDSLGTTSDSGEPTGILDEVQDDVHEGIANGDIDSNAGKFIAGMLDGIIDMLIP